MTLVGQILKFVFTDDAQAKHIELAEKLRFSINNKKSFVQINEKQMFLRQKFYNLD